LFEFFNSPDISETIQKLNSVIQTLHKDDIINFILKLRYATGYSKEFHNDTDIYK